MKLLFEKKLNLKDARSYAKKSGDKNKIHIDNKVEKFSNFKKPIIHGCYIVEEIFFKIKNIKNFENNIIENLQIFFKEPIFVNEKISIYLIKVKKNILKLGVFSGIIEKIFITIELKKQNNKKKTLFKKFSEKEFFTELKNISKSVGNFQNKINIISQIDIEFTKKFSKSNKVKKINSSLYELKIDNKNFSSSTKFLSLSSSFSEKKIFFDKKLENFKIVTNPKKILIIGGSSGLGKVLVNFLSKKNIDVTFTYNKNYNDAKTLHAKNKHLKYFKFNENILKNKKINQKLKYFSYIYFFPTPKIFEMTDDYFEFENLSKFINTYSIFLKNIINCLSKDKKYKIYVPSSKIVTLKHNKFFDYRLGKIIQENLCQFINLKSKNIKIYNPRLGVHYTRKTFHLMNNNFNYNNFLNSAIKIL